MIDAAVVGAGVVSRIHLKGIDRNPRMRLVGVCDIDSEAAESRAAEFDTEAFTDIETLLATDVDCVHICTPVQTHRELAARAIEAGVAVIIEKPVAMSAAEVDDLIVLADREGVPATAVHTHLSGPLVRRAREMIAAGEIGDVRGVDVIYTGQSWPDDVERGSWVFELPGGEFEEGLPHPIYLAIGLAGHPAAVDRIDAQATCSRSYEQGFTYDAAQVQYTTRDGALCNVKMLASSPVQQTVHVHGSDATLVLDLLTLSLQTIDRDYTGSPLRKARKTLDTARAQFGGLATAASFMVKRSVFDSWALEATLRPHYAIIDGFVDTLESGAAPPHPLQQAKWTIQIMESIRSAAERPPADAPTV